MCDGCQTWIHQDCVGMTVSQYLHFARFTHLQFFCHICCNVTNGSFNCLASLSRIAAHRPDVQEMRQQAESEQNLMAFYKVTLPPVCDVKRSDVMVHSASVSFLKDHSQWLLHQFVPAVVVGDGNCLFRSISLALYGSEGEYAMLRLLTAIEALLHPDLYDASSDDYYAPYKADFNLVLPNYNTFVHEVVSDGSYCDMLSVLCLSTVTQKPIQTWWPIAGRNDQPSPLTKLVVGRGVQTVNAVNVLWTIARQTVPVTINHFAPLIPLTADDNVQPIADPLEDGVADMEDEQPADEPVIIHAENEDEDVPQADGQPNNGIFLSLSDCIKYLQDSAHKATDYIPKGAC